MRHTEEDWERLSEMDKMYLKEKEMEMIHEWQQWEEEQREKLPAKIIVRTKEENYEHIRERQKTDGKS